MIEVDLPPIHAHEAATPDRIIRAFAEPPPPAPSEAQQLIALLRQLLGQPPTVNISPTPVNIQTTAPAVHVEPTPIEVRVSPPAVTVNAPVVNVSPANVQVDIKQPDRKPRSVLFEVELDAAGRIKSLLATEL